MSWICPWCGWENVQDDRIGRDEPKCVRCKHERTTREEIQKKQEGKLADIEKEIREIHQHLDPIIWELDDLYSEVAKLEMERDDYRKDLNELLKEKADLERFVLPEGFAHQIAPDQAKLPFEVPA